MAKKRGWWLGTLGTLLLVGGLAGAAETLRVYSVAEEGYVMSEKVVKSEQEWRAQLSADQYRITRQKGTEPAHSGAYLDHHEEGIYRCVGCGLDLFSSRVKYASGTGWPSYWEPVAVENVATRPDNSLFARRTEVLCARCDAHLGHVFKDGPPPTGLRYCINSLALTFVRSADLPSSDPQP